MEHTIKTAIDAAMQTYNESYNRRQCAVDAMVALRAVGKNEHGHDAASAAADAIACWLAVDATNR